MKNKKYESRLLRFLIAPLLEMTQGGKDSSRAFGGSE